MCPAANFDPNSESFKRVLRAFNTHIPATRQSKFAIDLDGCLVKDAQISNSAAIKQFEVTVVHNDKDAINPNSKHVIYIPANADCFQVHAIEMSLDANHGFTAVGFNYLGIGENGGNDGPEDLQLCLVAVIEFLYSRGVPYEQMVIKGRSFGGLIAITVLEKYHKLGANIKGIIDRAPASISKLAASVARDIYQKDVGIPLLPTLGYYGVFSAVKMLKLDLDGVRAFNSITAINPNALTIFYVRNDNVIPRSAQLSSYINPTFAAHVHELFATGSNNPHNESLMRMLLNLPGADYKVLAQKYIDLHVLAGTRTATPPELISQVMINTNKTAAIFTISQNLPSVTGNFGMEVMLNPRDFLFRLYHELDEKFLIRLVTESVGILQQFYSTSLALRASILDPTDNSKVLARIYSNKTLIHLKLSAECSFSQGAALIVAFVNLFLRNAHERTLFFDNAPNIAAVDLVQLFETLVKEQISLDTIELDEQLRLVLSACLSRMSHSPELDSLIDAKSRASSISTSLTASFG
jgi:hypothetical protein